MPFYTDEGAREFAGFASVAVKDSQGELIPMGVLKPSMDAYMRRGAPINLNHKNWTVGKVLSYDFRKTDNGDDGLYIHGTIHKDYPLDDDVWDAIKAGELDEMSIAGQFEMDEEGVAEWAAPMEISVTGKAVGSQAVNPECKIDAVSSKKSRAYARIMKGEMMDEEKEKEKPKEEEKSQIDEQINKKSEIDEKINEKADEVVPPQEGAGEASAIESILARLSKIEEMLDMLMEMEEQEQGTDAIIGKADKEEAPEEPLAKFQKDLESVRGELVEIKAKFAKTERTGVRKTLQSGGMNEPDIVQEVRAIIGDI